MAAQLTKAEASTRRFVRSKFTFATSGDAFTHAFNLTSLIATVLKFGDRTQIGAVHLSTSLVADLQLITAAMVWGYAAHISASGLTPEMTARVVSLSGGALFANIVSVIILIAETIMQRR